MDIRQLQYLAALAREKHFTRAATACNVTQPTLSGRIRQLELELEVPIVERGQRYQGLTPEGERVLKWAQVILKNWQSMQEEINQLKGLDRGLSGRLVLGGIPSALPLVPRLTQKIGEIHPGIEFIVLSQSSEEILRGIADYSVDVGITYLDNEPIEKMLATPLYTERYCLFVPENHPLAGREAVTWQEAAQQPLCLLTSNMQNRRIIDRAFERANCQVNPRLETNSVINLCANVRLMGLASIMPLYILEVLGNTSGVKAIPLVEPTVEHSVGLVVADRDPLSPLIDALRETATKLTLGEMETGFNS
ncbi:MULTISPECIES: LysR family transcriptional regulator [Hyphomicrobium]|uniref:Hydrogen peroxide-inducible genes activator n=1 Tax=Hyphomicrobium sulfonivorans TaxID=121290 RepID=A0A109BJF7_HYPSL|nr:MULTISPECIES: LysR family transcriptional regulator [Hyphomicrobium]KWT69941.1 Hydrogen peroxide-inducible genes activator [Hyphomicrobium sulfonivorans]MBI1649042.1 LysR family transcriptional regulator [Hyphomicrobium sulfonivorans]MDH4983935.1 LysR family transcriptional regulator [Hyphomicrobium sp. D-2]NSL70424.1 LysR family transcriptional regulator [Hyphomicrobium sulfonivorans]